MTMVKTYQRTEYPRPQFQRQSWMNLNGTWKFAFDDHNTGEKGSWHDKPSFSTEIQVPFTYETKASGIGEQKFHPYIWYQRTFEIPKEEIGKRTILRFQASDYLVLYASAAAPTAIFIASTYILRKQLPRDSSILHATVYATGDSDPAYDQKRLCYLLSP